MGEVVSVALSVLVLVLNFTLGNVPSLKVKPKPIADGLVVAAFVIAVLATSGIVDWFPITFITAPGGAVVLLVVLALLPVLAGLCEGWLTKGKAYTMSASHWAGDHLKNNLLGALAGISILLFLYSVRQEVVPYIAGVLWRDYLEAVLAVSALAAVWFVAVQQRAEQSKNSASTLPQSTLRNLNQILNVVWLTFIMAVGVRGGIYIIGFLRHVSVNHVPITFSWWTLWLFVAMLAFLFSYGQHPDKPEIYVTFLTGTPVAILVEFVCLSLYRIGDGVEVARWVYPTVCLALYAVVVGLTYSRLEKGRISMFSLVPTFLCIVAFAILMTVW